MIAFNYDVDCLLAFLLEEKGYWFRDHQWLSRADGFGHPVDVYYNAIFLGVIETEANGYVIKMVKGPTMDVTILPGSNNQFKTKDDAALAIHRAWAAERK